MEMSNDEIIRNYRAAKNKKMQIGILADLNCCDRKTIKNIVEPPNNLFTETCTVDEKAVDWDKVIKYLYEELDCLEGQIKPLENRYRKVVNAIDAFSALVKSEKSEKK